MKKQDFKNKHDHKLTDWLKVIIFSILMMAPFFSITTRCLYVINNKNAKDSYYGENINEKTYISETINNLELNNTYYLVNSSTSIQYTYIPGNTEITATNVYLNDVYKNVTAIRVYVTTSNNNLYFQLIGSEGSVVTTASIFTIKFDYVGINNNTYENDINSLLYKVEYNKNSFLDNAFDYSISQLQQSPTFNWTTQTATYDVFNNMLTGLTIQNGILPLLLTYWMMLIVVYIIIDIIIKTFTFITHLISQ